MCEVIIQNGILRGSFEEDNYDPYVEGDDGTVYLVGSGSFVLLGKVLKAGDEVNFVDVSPTYKDYDGPKYCSLVCPYCNKYS